MSTPAIEDARAKVAGCTTCGGTGELREEIPRGDGGIETSWDPCPDCGLVASLLYDVERIEHAMNVQSQDIHDIASWYRRALLSNTRLQRERNEALEAFDQRTKERDSALLAAHLTGCDLQTIGARCGMRDDEYPLKAFERFSFETGVALGTAHRERDEARHMYEVILESRAKAEEHGDQFAKERDSALEELRKVVASRNALQEIVQALRPHEGEPMPLTRSTLLASISNIQRKDLKREVLIDAQTLLDLYKVALKWFERGAS